MSAPVVPFSRTRVLGVQSSDVEVSEVHCAPALSVIGVEFDEDTIID